MPSSYLIHAATSAIDTPRRHDALALASHGVPGGARLAPERMARGVGLAMDVGVSRVEQLLVSGHGERVHRRAF